MRAPLVSWISTQVRLFYGDQWMHKSRGDEVCPFKANSGYGMPGINPDSTQMMPHYAGWTGYDMSSWLPLIKA